MSLYVTLPQISTEPQNPQSPLSSSAFSDYGACIRLCSLVQTFGEMLMATGPYSQLGYLRVSLLDTLWSDHELLKSRIRLTQWSTWCTPSTVHESIGRRCSAKLTYFF